MFLTRTSERQSIALKKSHFCVKARSVYFPLCVKSVKCCATPVGIKYRAGQISNDCWLNLRMFDIIGMLKALPNAKCN